MGLLRVTRQLLMSGQVLVLHWKSTVRRLVFFAECGETGDSKIKTVAPLAHASIRMKVEESGRLLCDKAALLVHMLVGLEALPSSLGTLVIPFLAECPDWGVGGARKNGGRGNSC